ncbi:nectin-3-like protein [Oncorhynchus tshawytscha]|uniref:Nectin cell adhesion molecule 3 n=1 Tax=Oncorhynchus tshawytscha TaxID=74940 RepID=A0A8C8DCM5_ONCTS|nr:nectin-3-like protein [Oncorhynchus tshawytscha]
MAKRLLLDYHKSLPLNGLQTSTVLLLIYVFTCVCSNEVLVPERVSAVLGKNITLGCRVEVGTNLSLTQSSWERRLPSGTITLAVFNPQFGISISPDYARRLSFLNPSVHDATIVLEGVGFQDIGSYTCKVATFPLGNTQASTTVNILVEPKVYVSAGSTALVDGGNESVAATCIAERGRPAAEVSWETELFGRSEVQTQDEPNGTSTTQVRYVLEPRRHSQGHTLTCVVRHPALQTEFRIPYVLNVQFAPEVTVVGYDQNWFVGQDNVKLDCGAKANPPAHHFSWTRLDGPMPDGVDIVNNTFTFTRPLERNDSGLYRCEVSNDIGPRGQDVHVWIQDPPPTTAPVSTTSTPLFLDTSDTSTAPNKRRGVSGHSTSPTLASLSDSSLGTIVGGAVGGVLFLVLLLILGGACFMRQRRTFRGDYYTKQYLGPSDMQKESQLDVLQPHELQEVYGDGPNSTYKGSQELKPKPGLGGDIIYPNDIQDRDDWGDGHRGLREGSYFPAENQNTIHHPRGLPVHTPTVTNGSPYLPEDCFDNGTDSEYVSHMDGSVISRREWYV